MPQDDHELLRGRIERLADAVAELAMHITMLNVIYENASKINEANFGRIFWIWQTSSASLAVLAIGRIYDRDKKHKQYSIPAILRYLRSAKCDNVNQLRSCLSRCPSFFQPPSDLRANQLQSYALAKTDAFLQKGWFQMRLDRCWSYRDKRLTHSDFPPPEATVTMNDLNILLRFAEAFVSVIGLSFLNVAYGEDTEPSWFVQSLAGSSSAALIRLLKKIGTEPIYPTQFACALPKRL